MSKKAQKASPFGSNGDDRRQWRKQGGAVGAAASRMQATAKQTLGAATRAVASRSDDGEGKPVSREPLRSDKQALWQNDAIAAPALLRQHPCPLRRSAPALPKGEPWAKRAGFAGCKSLSPWERWHRASYDGEGKPVSREPPCSDKPSLWQSQNLTGFLHSRRKQGDSRRFY